MWNKNRNKKQKSNGKYRIYYCNSIKSVTLSGNYKITIKPLKILWIY
jgi:hypothetical protein